MVRWCPMACALRWAAFAVLACPLAPAAATITPLGGYVHGGATSRIEGQTLATGRLADPLTGFGQDFGIYPNADMRLGDTTVMNHFTATARWDSAAAGSLQFAALTAIISTDPDSLLTAQSNYDFTWFYEVKFDKTTTLSLDAYEGANNTLNRPDHGELDFLRDNGTFNSIWEATQGTTSLTQTFEPGSYKFFFTANGSVSDLLNVNYSSFLGVQFLWKFTEEGAADGAVPEPASWAMMLGGFGLTGGALRVSRRRRAIVTGSATA